jgi:hypothetical protein
MEEVLMFQGFGNMSLRKRAENASDPGHFQDLVAYDTVAGRPLSTVTAGTYTPVSVNIGMTSPAPAKMSPFVAMLKY